MESGITGVNWPPGSDFRTRTVFINASILVDKGWDILQIKDWLGHSDIDTTANIYAHISHNRKVSMAKDLHNMLSFGMDDDDE